MKQKSSKDTINIKDKILKTKMDKKKSKIDTKDPAMSYYSVKINYKVRTFEQAKELQSALEALYKKKVEKWCGVKLPPNWGSKDNTALGCDKFNFQPIK